MRSYFLKSGTKYMIEFKVLIPVVTFWNIVPCSSLKVNRRFGEHIAPISHGRISRARYQRESSWKSNAFTLVYCSDYFTLKMEVIFSSEKSADFTRQYSSTYMVFRKYTHSPIHDTGSILQLNPNFRTGYVVFIKQNKEKTLVNLMASRWM
jgi:hypothetical protein